MNEDTYRNQVNVIYGAPCEVIAAGDDRNLVQGAEPPTTTKPKRDPLQDLESILEFGYGKDELKKERNENQRKRVVQGSVSNYVSKDKVSILERVLEFAWG